MSVDTRRFYATLLFSNAADQSGWAGGFFRQPAKPTREELFELPDPPRPAEGDTRPLYAWKVKVDFVCHDVKFGHADEGVFQWPEQPASATLETMARVLMAERLAMRGDGPDYVDYSDILALSVEPTSDEPDHPLVTA